MRKSKANVWQKISFFIVLVLIAAVVLGAVFGLEIGGKKVIKNIKEIRTGIDIRGGVNATFVPSDDKATPTDAELESARAIIETRMDAQNILDRNVTIDKEAKAIVVEFPWQTGEKDFNPEEAITELGSTANLTFCTLKTGSDGNLLTDDKGQYVPEKVVMEGKHVDDCSAELDNEGSYYIALSLTSEGKSVFADATGNNVGKQIGIFMDETMISAPTVQEKIESDQASITGSFSADEAKNLASKIKAGALPYALKSSNYSSISPTLGSGALKIMIYAGILSFILIALFMILYYRLPGVVAVLNLIMQIAGQLLIFSSLKLTLTLPGIAGIILAIGMGVDSNIIISERIREEIKNGKSIIGAVENGFSRAMSSVADCNITTFIIAILLIIFGSGTMLSFGYTLVIGIIMNFVVGVVLSRIMTKSLSSYGALRKPFLYGVKSEKEAK